MLLSLTYYVTNKTKTKDRRLKAKNWLRPEPEDLINFRPVKLHVLSAYCFVRSQNARNLDGVLVI